METDRSNPKTFISYCHADKENVDRVDNALKSLGLTLTRDIRDAKAYTSIKDFMGRIKNSDYVILVVSDSYMRSRNCMYEILELLKNDDYRNHIFPIVIKSADFNIYSDDSLTSYLGYWDNEYKELERKSAGFRPEEKVEIDAKKRMITNIKLSINSFIETLRELKAPPLEELEKNNFGPITEVIKPTLIDRGLLDKCLKYLKLEDMETAKKRFQADNSIEFANWLMEKIKPSNFTDYDAPQRIVLLAEIITKTGILMKMGEYSAELPAATSIESIYRAVIVDDLFKPSPVASFNFEADHIKEIHEKLDRPIILSLFEALRTIGYLQHDTFTYELLTECFRYYIEPQDREAALQQLRNCNRDELGDWLLGHIHTGGRSEASSYTYILLAKIMREMGKMTPKAKEVRDNIISSLKTGSFDYDPEFNDLVMLKRMSMEKALKMIGDEVSLSALAAK